MDTAGFTDTKIIIPDGGDVKGIEQAMAADAQFAAAVDGFGLHYPCNRPAPETRTTWGKKYWSSEDYSTVGNWAGAACWGRLLNQNYIRMNQTSTIAWALIWSVYETGFPYFGNGLMYAMTPWSGYYEAGMPGSSNGGAIWTNAHTGQFTEPGWKYLAGEGVGMLANGGSWVGMVSPDGQEVTLTVEKLEGRCLRCAGQTTETETVQFKLSGGLERHTVLQVWTTDKQDQFIQQSNISASADGTFSYSIQKDSIVTFSSWFNGQHKAVVDIPVAAPFPKELSDNFESYEVDAEARFFADNGGSFTVVDDGAVGKVLKQWVRQENGVNRWVNNVNPVTLLGNASWQDLKVSVDVTVPPAQPGPPGPPPPPPSPYTYLRNKFNQECLDTKGAKRCVVAYALLPDALPPHPT